MEQKPLDILDCEVSSHQSEDVSSSESTSRGRESYKSDVCEVSSSAVSSKRKHELRHNKGRLYNCEVCGKTYNAQYLKLHVLIHTGEKPHKCGLCGKAFTQASHLNSHKLVHTGEKKYKCEQCGKAFTHAGNLKTHQVVHTGEKPHKCGMCGKAFTQAIGLKTHHLVHSGEKPHKCGMCGKAFTQASKLKRHKLSFHNRNKKVKCSICQFCTFFKASLVEHLSTHIMEGLHGCLDCEYYTRSMDKLRSHIYEHRDELIKCPHCVSQFKSIVGLRYHLLDHTLEAPYKCAVCDRTFKQKIIATKHWRIVHKHDRGLDSF